MRRVFSGISVALAGTLLERGDGAAERVDVLALLPGELNVLRVLLLADLRGLREVRLRHLQGRAFGCTLGVEVRVVTPPGRT